MDRSDGFDLVLEIETPKEVCRSQWAFVNWCSFVVAIYDAVAMVKMLINYSIEWIVEGKFLSVLYSMTKNKKP